MNDSLILCALDLINDDKEITLITTAGTIKGKVVPIDFKGSLTYNAVTINAEALKQIDIVPPRSITLMDVTLIEGGHVPFCTLMLDSIIGFCID